MPRRDWNTSSAHSQKQRHARMHSGARGKGHDKKTRAAKRNLDLCGYCRTPAIQPRDRSRNDD